MNLFTDTSIKRRTAFAVLVFWLFALTSGWANACLLQNRDTHLHGTDDLLAVVTVQGPLVSPAHLGTDSVHPENEGLAKGACLKVCGDSPHALVKLLANADLTDIAAAQSWEIAWTPSSSVELRAYRWQKQPAPAQGPPLRTRFSRLAL